MKGEDTPTAWNAALPCDFMLCIVFICIFILLMFGAPNARAGSKLPGHMQKPTFVFSHLSPQFCGIILMLPHAHTMTQPRVDNLT
jgi:hypothetical protein